MTQEYFNNPGVRRDDRYTNYDISLTITEVPYRIQTANNMTANGGVDTFVQ